MSVVRRYNNNLWVEEIKGMFHVVSKSEELGEFKDKYNAIEHMNELGDTGKYDNYVRLDIEGDETQSHSEMEDYTHYLERKGNGER